MSSAVLFRPKIETPKRSAAKRRSSKEMHVTGKNKVQNGEGLQSRDSCRFSGKNVQKPAGILIVKCSLPAVKTLYCQLQKTFNF
jgi:hypothetical protein